MFSSNEILEIIGRENHLFQEDLKELNALLCQKTEISSFLVIGAAGSIGKAVSKEILLRNPKSVHLVDINENNLAELVRDFRSDKSINKQNFETFCLDVGSSIFSSFLKSNQYDYVLNLSAMKHVRSERDPFTLMRMIKTNIHNSLKIINDLEDSSKKYFCVSTDKASNPVSLMGASKRIMEICLFKSNSEISTSMARFANVAFSDGSLLDGFLNRIKKKQPISAPLDIERYFITPKESGLLCLFSLILGEKNEIFFPNNSSIIKLLKFDEIAKNVLKTQNYLPYVCESEDEARFKTNELIGDGKWPCYFFVSDTSGEKEYEEFYMENEELNLKKFKEIGIVIPKPKSFDIDIDNFFQEINFLEKKKTWSKKEILQIFNKLLPEFNHLEKEQNLDQKM